MRISKQKRAAQLHATESAAELRSPLASLRARVRAQVCAAGIAIDHSYQTALPKTLNLFMAHASARMRAPEPESAHARLTQRTHPLAGRRMPVSRVCSTAECARPVAQQGGLGGERRRSMRKQL